MSPFAGRIARHNPGSSPPPPPSANNSGIWAIRSVQSQAELTNNTAEINNALVNFRTTGFSMRFPWNAADNAAGTLSTAARNFFSQGAQIASNASATGAPKVFTMRMMAGLYTPTRVTNDANCPFYLDGTTRVPLPFHPDGSSNTVFEAAYTDQVTAMAAWCRQNGVSLLHLPWYGHNYSEVDNGTPVTTSPGYSYANFITAHKRLVDAVWDLAGDDLALEWPMTGHGSVTTPSPGFTTDMTDYIRGKTGVNLSPHFYVQGNGWDTSGMRGGAAEEPAFRADILASNVRLGLQMINTGDYDWGSATTGVFQYLYPRAGQWPGGYYGEIYTNGGATGSFGANAAHIANLRTQIANFADFIGAPV